LHLDCGRINQTYLEDGEIMKKLLFLMLLTPFAYADGICQIQVETTLEIGGDLKKYSSSKKCLGGGTNILNLRIIDSPLQESSLLTVHESLLYTASRFCKFDKTIVIKDSMLSCVIESSSARQL
jgi:hypothetical protein